MALASACASEDAAAGKPWQLVHEDLDSALISVSGTAADDVWTVGAYSGEDEGALALHFDGTSWQRVPTGTHEHLWWVHPFSRDLLMVGGTGGTILRYEGEAFEPMETPGSSTVYGIWGAAEDDVWAVGGEPDVSPGFVWRFDGTSWRDVTAELPAEARGPVVFKVWGQSADDVWLVGTDGFALHWDGERYELGETGTTQRLFTVSGVRGGEPGFVAVGGYGRATILEHDGTAWHDVTPQTGVDESAIAQLFGVAMQGPQRGYAVGYDGTVLRRDDQGWSRVELGVEIFNPFHAVWIDPDGGVWAVGGDVLTPALDEGMLVYSGEDISNAIEP